MIMNRRFGLVVVILVCALLASGCVERKSKFGRLSDRDYVARLSDTEIEDDTLQPRPKEIDIIPAITFDNVQFEYDSAQVGQTERKTIEAVAEYLKEHPELGVIIEGHCDERGSREYNITLGERRALAVRAYLIGLSVDGAQIQTKSYGEEHPLRLGHDEDSWLVNRRAEFVFFD